MAAEIQNQDFVISGYRSTITHLDAKVVSLENKLSEFSRGEKLSRERSRAPAEIENQKLESVDIEPKQKILVEEHKDQQLLMADEINRLKACLDQCESRIRELEGSRASSELHDEIQARDNYIKELESEVAAFKTIASTMKLSLGYPEELRMLRQTNHRLKQELEAAQDRLLNMETNALPTVVASEPAFEAPHSFLNLEISSLLEQEQEVVAALSKQLAALKEQLSGDLSVDERVAKLAAGQADCIATVADLTRQAVAARARVSESSAGSASASSK